MDRRAFMMVTAGGFIGVHRSAHAQQPTKKRRIGLLSLTDGSEPSAVALRAFGWIEGQNLIVERRNANGGVQLLQPMAEELVRLNVELIVSNGTVASLAAKRATRRVPIVIDRCGDPVGTGLVATLARPGGNITGTSTMSLELDIKRLELLRELLPGATRVGVLIDRSNPLDALTRKNLQQAFQSLRMASIFVEVSTASELERAIAEVAREGAHGLILDADPLFAQEFPEIVRVAESYRLPVMVERREWLEGGGLVAYGPSQTQLDRQLAVIIDKVLRGARPADLPIEQPSQFELAINLKSAKALGVTVPKSVLLRADEVIQ